MKVADFCGISLLASPVLSIFQWNNLAGLLQVKSAYLLLSMLLIVLFLAIPFAVCVCLGSRLGVLFSSLRPLSAYSLNVFGAIVGSILFPVLSALCLAPWQLLLLPTAFISADLWLKTKKYKPIQLIPLVAIVVVYMLVPYGRNMPLFPGLNGLYQTGELKTLWSPYQRIDLCVFEDRKRLSRNLSV